VLILTRRIGETVIIGNEIFCTLLGQQRNGQMILAFDAPKPVPIHRLEVQRRILQKINDGSFEREINWNETVIEQLTRQAIRTIQ
jgi:carbon storage regulator